VRERANRDVLKWSFDRQAALYDRARPPYPEQIFDDLIRLAGLGSPPAVVEIGCGPGRASRMLAARGCRLTCLELGPRMSALARRNLARFPHVDVITSAFEDWDPQDARFDMVFAASSWHWLDPEIRYAKAAHVLKPGGVLALLSGSHAFPEGFDPFFTEIQTCYAALGESRPAWPPPTPDRVADRRTEIESSRLFTVDAITRYVWAVDFTAESFIDELNTHSGHMAWPQWKRETLHAEIRRLMAMRREGYLRKHYLSILHVCRRR
jgi:SAM-dependent methyltransferase